MCWPLTYYHPYIFVLHITSDSCAPLWTFQRTTLIATRQETYHLYWSQPLNLQFCNWPRWWCHWKSMCHTNIYARNRNEATCCQCTKINIFYSTSHFGLARHRRILYLQRHARMHACTRTHIHTHAPNETSQKRQCKRLLSHFGFSKQMHVKPTNFKAAAIGSLLLETTTDIKQNRGDDLTSFCFHFFQHAWKDKWSTNQYFPLQTLYWLKSSMLHFILYCCIIAQQMTRQMTLHIPVPGRWQDELTFYHLWGKKECLES